MSSMNGVSDGGRSTSLPSSLPCGDSQGYALQNNEIMGILTVLFQYVGVGTRLALCGVGWLG